MKEKNTEIARYIANFILKMAGADVVAPAELKDRIVKRFITEGPGKKVQKEFESFAEVLNTMSQKEQEAVIAALAFTLLKPSAYKNISDISGNIVLEHMEYIKEHPEYKQMPDVNNSEDLENLLGI